MDLLGDKMFVRVYDKLEKRYYKSMVYGLINSGYYEQAILFNPYINKFELVEYIDKDTQELDTLYECINSNTSEWITYERTFLLKLKKYCKDNNFNHEINLFRGYKDVFDNFEFILKILRNKNVPLEETNIKVKLNEDIDEWNYIRNQEDANNFMSMFMGFHDSTLDKLIYEEDYGKTQLKVQFDNSGWYGVVELCFEGLIALNLKGLVENRTREIYDATLIINNESVFWADGELENEDYNYVGTYIKALNLKWRKIN
ncbi:MAG: hypothetical protein E6371_18825 [Terrisporobacter othiniensis]|nr:hypothetical protein [Terrisporobacter othiniensis]